MTFSHSVLLLLVWFPLMATAHQPSSSYLTVYLDGDRPSVRWDIALRDLDYSVGIDHNADGAITWGEIRVRHTAISDYALTRLRVTAAGKPCALSPGLQKVVEHSDGAYAVLPVALDCSRNGPLELEYRLLFDLDPSHRGLLQVRRRDGVQTAVLSPDRPTFDLLPTTPGFWEPFTAYWKEGVWHIWIGYDHILFLLALLLPSVLWLDNGRWRAVSSLRSALKDVIAIVTAFTIAHSVTLSLSVLGWVSLPGRWVESAIAATVALAALNNLYPLVRGRRWLIAFALGLIHGFGFAGVLSDLGLFGVDLFPALVGFNLGVETGQLGIVALFVPAAYLLRETLFYRRAALGMGSATVAGVALIWLVERSLNLSLW